MCLDLSGKVSFNEIKHFNKIKHSRKIPARVWALLIKTTPLLIVLKGKDIYNLFCIDSFFSAKYNIDFTQQIEKIKDKI